ncbi:MAG: hypothetical protein J6Y85_02150 [Alphaproteobacteria bacterium]|nr:hypothetical protein [Alphaproteobacteria bacterium]
MASRKKHKKRMTRQTMADLPQEVIEARVKELAQLLQITLQEVRQLYDSNNELATMKPQTIKDYAVKNCAVMGLKLAEWIKMCMKWPRLFEVKEKTLKRHKEENTVFLGIGEEDWRRLCKQEPVLAVTTLKKMKRSAKYNAMAMNVTPEEWRECCLRRGALLIYKPGTLRKKIRLFVKYLANPKKLEGAYAKMPEYARPIIRRAERRRDLSLAYIKKQFVTHPILLICSPEKLAYTYLILSEEKKNYCSDIKEEDLFSYLNTSAERLALGHFYACWAKHHGLPVDLYHFAGAKESEIKSALRMLAGRDEVGTSKKEMIDAYVQNWPLKQLPLKGGAEAFQRHALSQKLISILGQKTSSR